MPTPNRACSGCVLWTVPMRGPETKQSGIGIRLETVHMKNFVTKKTAMKYWKEWRLTLFLIVFVILPVKSSLADFNWVPTGSMKPTILEGDFVFVNKAAYGLRVPLTLLRLAHWADPGRGDVVICFSPDDGTRLIKRVVGLPGDRLELRNNQLFINGRAMAQSEMMPKAIWYRTAQTSTSTCRSRPAIAQCR